MLKWVEKPDFEDWLADFVRTAEITTELNLKQDICIVWEASRSIRPEDIQEV